MPGHWAFCRVFLAWERPPRDHLWVLTRSPGMKAVAVAFSIAWRGGEVEPSGWATMHRVTRRCSSVGRAAVLETGNRRPSELRINRASSWFRHVFGTGDP